MLARSVVAALCGVLAVVALPGPADLGIDGDYFDLYRNSIGQETLTEPGRTLLPNERCNACNDHPKHPPIPPVPRPPHHGPHDPHVSKKTIYQALEEDRRFSRFFKLVNYTEEITNLLNDSSSSLTLFAVPDKALKPPKKHRKHHRHLGLNFDDVDIDPLFNTFAADLASTTDERELFSVAEGFVDYDLLDDNDDDKERKKKIIKAIVTAVLKYHILPGELPAATLATNNTYSTGLKLNDGSLDSEAFRVRISSAPRLVHPELRVNFYASVLYADVKANNGLVHILNHPLFPPPSMFTVLFAFSDVFSTLTSALQRVNITDAVDWYWDHSSKTLNGSPAITFFAPTNGAFASLPRKLKFYLFSPFGAHALKKILTYHVVPDYIFHTNWAHNASDSLARTSHGSMTEDPYSFLRSQYLDTVEMTFAEEQECNTMIGNAQPKLHVERLAMPMACSSRRWKWHEDNFGKGWVQDHRPSTQDCPGLSSAPPMCSQCLNLPPTAESLFNARARNPCGGHFPMSGLPQSPPRFPVPPSTPNTNPHPPHHEPKHPHFPHQKPVYSLNATLPSLLPSHNLHVHVAQYHSVLSKGGYVTKVFVNGVWVAAPDVPTRNGAVHVVRQLIRPFRKGRHGHEHDEQAWFEMAMLDESERNNDWDDWEEWLPQWANED